MNAATESLALYCSTRRWWWHHCFWSNSTHNIIAEQMQVIHTHIFLFLSIGSFIHFLIQSN